MVPILRVNPEGSAETATDESSSIQTENKEETMTIYQVNVDEVPLPTPAGTVMDRPRASRNQSQLAA